MNLPLPPVRSRGDEGIAPYTVGKVLPFNGTQILSLRVPSTPVPAAPVHPLQQERVWPYPARLYVHPGVATPVCALARNDTAISYIAKFLFINQSAHLCFSICHSQNLHPLFWDSTSHYKTGSIFMDPKKNWPYPYAIFAGKAFLRLAAPPIEAFSGNALYSW